MLDGYNRTFNIHGWGSLLKPAEIPNPELAIDSAEYFTSIPFKFEYENPVQFQFTPQDFRAMDDATIDGQGAGFIPDQFPSNKYLGEYLSEV